MASVILRNVASKPFTPNGQVVFTVPRGGKIRRLNIVLSGSIAVTAGAASGVVKGEGGPINLINRITVTATRDSASRYGGGDLVNCTPRSLLRYAIFQHNGKFVAELAASTLGAGVAAVYAIYLSIPVYFADSTLRNGYATCLNAEQGVYSSIQVKIDTADLKACFTGNDRVVDWSALNVDLVMDKVDYPQDTYEMVQEDHAVLIGATNERMLDEAMPKNGGFTAWLIMQESTAARTLVDTLLNRVTVKAPTLDFYLKSNDIKARMIEDEWIDPAQSMVGLNFIDHTDGTLMNTLPAAGLDASFNVTNVSGANADDLLIYTRRIFIPAKAA